MIAAVPFMLVFRFLHILAGVLWVGSAFLFVGFIGPSAVDVGPLRPAAARGGGQEAEGREGDHRPRRGDRARRLDLVVAQHGPVPLT